MKRAPDSCRKLLDFGLPQTVLLMLFSMSVKTCYVDLWLIWVQHSAEGRMEPSLRCTNTLSKPSLFLHLMTTPNLYFSIRGYFSRISMALLRVVGAFLAFKSLSLVLAQTGIFSDLPALPILLFSLSPA